MELKSKDLKVFIFESSRGSEDLEEYMNKWFLKYDVTVIDIKYSANVSYNDGRCERLYTAMILYKENVK